MPPIKTPTKPKSPPAPTGTPFPPDWPETMAKKSAAEIRNLVRIEVNILMAPLYERIEALESERRKNDTDDIPF